jgi:hypothetical protein
MKARLVVVVEASGSLREIREHYGDGQRAAIQRAYDSGRIELQVAEELWRTLPDRVPRQ